MNYYNENDPKMAAWLRELLRAGLIPAGVVDTRSIKDVRIDDLAGFAGCHFFAGIGGWPLALRLAGWPDDRSVWTGSCPCQPFSAAGQGKAEADERHLWPEFFRLIAEPEQPPAVVFGEQVASALGRLWLAGVRADLESLGYAVGAADLCAAGVGAPHIRQRLYWVAESLRERGLQSPRGGSCEASEQRFADGGAAGGLGFSDGERTGLDTQALFAGQPESGGHGATDGLADVRGAGLPGRQEPAARQEPSAIERDRAVGRLVHPPSDRREQRGAESVRRGIATSSTPRAWDDFDILPCADGKARRVESGTFPLAHGVPGRVGLLRGYGNAIVPQVAAQFILAWLDTQSLTAL